MEELQGTRDWQTVAIQLEYEWSVGPNMEIYYWIFVT